jgi:hypothetical protein
MGNEVEAGAQCVRDHLQRPNHPDLPLEMPRSDPPLIGQPRSRCKRCLGTPVNDVPRHHMVGLTEFEPATT